MASIELRVDEDARPRLGLLVVLKIDGEEPLPDRDLRRRQTDTRRVVHRREHVVDQLLEDRIGDLGRIDFLRDLAQRRVPLGEDLAEIRHGSAPSITEPRQAGLPRGRGRGSELPPTSSRRQYTSRWG